MELATLEDLLVEELKDLYSAEKQIVKALPKMVKAASNADLKKGFEDHLAQSEEHIVRLEKVFEELGRKATAKPCKAMKGLLEEGGEMIKQDADPDVRDAGLIAAAQRVEHYEMAAYGTVRAYAEMLGHETAVELLTETYDEERETDHKLTELAMSTINVDAMAGVSDTAGAERGTRKSGRNDS